MDNCEKMYKEMYKCIKSYSVLQKFDKCNNSATPKKYF